MTQTNPSGAAIVARTESISPKSCDRHEPAGPPRPPLALRIGVTGHRPTPARPTPDVEKLRGAVREILQCVAETYVDVADRHRDLFAIQPESAVNPRFGLRIISALAAGADQWVAGEAIALGYELQAPLPLPRDDYRLDFDKDDPGRATYDRLLVQATAVLELDGKVGKDEQGLRHVDPHSYVAVGEAVLDQSDLLIALWDGKPKDKDGGTADIVLRARQLGIPIVWIPWDGSGPWQLLLPGQQRFHHAGAVKAREDLERAVRELLLPPRSSAPSHAGRTVDPWTEFCGELQKRGNPLLGWWALFRDLVCGEFRSHGKQWRRLEAFRVADFDPAPAIPIEKPPPAAASPAKIAPGETTLGAPQLAAGTAEASIQRLRRPFERPYAWANGLSLYYSNLYRSSFVVTFLLGALAVLCAVVAHFPWAHETVLSHVAELTLIVTILLVTWRGRSRHWHEHWIDYRTLAERIRLAEYLAVWGGTGQQASKSTTPAHLAGYGKPTDTWMHWYYRAIERAAGLPTAKFDGSYLSACRNLWCQELIEEQIKYHQVTHHRSKHIDHVLHLTGAGLFGITLGVCAVHIALHLGHSALSSWHPFDFEFDLESINPWFLLLAAFLPALGAALAGIRSQGEFYRVSQRCGAMHDRLTELKEKIEAIPTNPGELNSRRLREASRDVAHTMANEMLDWRVVFQDRPLGLPS